MNENAIQRIELMTVLQVTFLTGAIVTALALAVTPLVRRLVDVTGEAAAFPSAQPPCKVAAL